jgi:hypothetical protein
MVDVTQQDLAAPAGGADEAEQHADGGRLTGAVGSDESADGSARDGEVEVVDDAALPELLRQPGRDHGQVRPMLRRHRRHALWLGSMRPTVRKDPVDGRLTQG